MVVYLDSLILHSFILDFIQIKILSLLFQCELARKRHLLSALLAAAYVPIELFFPLDSWLPPLRLLWPLLVVGVAFGVFPLQRLLTLFVGWYLVAAAASGLGRFLSLVVLPLSSRLHAETVYFPAWLPALLLLLGQRTLPSLKQLWQRRFREGLRIYPVRIESPCGGAELKALWDSGNLLREPLRGDPVLILHYRCLDSFSDALRMPDRFDVLDRVPTAQLSSATYRSLGGGEREMLLVWPETVRVQDGSAWQTLRCWLGLSDDSLLLEGSFQAILPADWACEREIRKGGETYDESADRESLACFHQADKTSVEVE